MKSRLFTTLSLVAILSITIYTDCNKNPLEPSLNFSPSTAASTWTYVNTPGGTFTLTSTNRDTTINSSSYHVYTSTAGGNTYMRKSGDDYYRFGNIAAIGATIEELYLKQNLNVNESWTQTLPFTVPQLPGIPLVATLNYGVKEKGVARTVGTKSFTNVTHIRLDITVSNLGAVADGEFYYAAGIGLIENLINIKSIPLAGITASTSTQKITDYNIK